MRINSLQVHPTPMWTSTLRGCQATPVSHCVKLKHNHPRPSPSYEPGNPPSSPLSLRPPLFSFSPLHFPSSATVHRPPLLFSFPLPRRRLLYLYSHPYRPFQSLTTFFHPSPTFLIFVIFSPLFSLLLFFFFSFSSSASSSPSRIQFLSPFSSFLFVHLFGFFLLLLCLLSFFFFFIYIYIYFFFLYDFS